MLVQLHLFLLLKGTKIPPVLALSMCCFYFSNLLLVYYVLWSICRCGKVNYVLQVMWEERNNGGILVVGCLLFNVWHSTQNFKDYNTELFHKKMRR